MFVDAGRPRSTVTFDDVACTPAVPEDPIVLPPGPSRRRPSSCPPRRASSTPSTQLPPRPLQSSSRPCATGTRGDHSRPSWTQDNATTARFGLASPTPTTTSDELARTGAAKLVVQSIVRGLHAGRRLRAQPTRASARRPLTARLTDSQVAPTRRRRYRSATTEVAEPRRRRRTGRSPDGRLPRGDRRRGRSPPACWRP